MTAKTTRPATIPRGMQRSNVILTTPRVCNGTEVVMRGMDHKESAQELMEAMRIYRNYIKPHQGLDGKTPAEASGIKIEGTNKWKTLIENASRKD